MKTTAKLLKLETVRKETNWKKVGSEAFPEHSESLELM